MLENLFSTVFKTYYELIGGARSEICEYFNEVKSFIPGRFSLDSN